MSDQDTQGGGNMVLAPIRWEQAQLDRAQAVADRTGLPRSVIMRAAFDHGIPIVERSIEALAVAPAGQ